MKQYTQEQVIERLKAKLATGNIIVAAGAGTGISARFEEEGGADMILVFNSGRYRMHGLGSLSGWMAYGNANTITLEMGEREILPIVKEVPVVCSINGTDPTFVMEVFLKRVKAAGFSGDLTLPYDFLDELEQMSPDERHLILDELAQRPELWDEESEVMFI